MTLPVKRLTSVDSARATSAAPTYFKPFFHEPSKQVYQDGGLYHNNPIEIADIERKLIWPEMERQYPDIVLSLGTGFNPASKKAVLEAAPPPRLGIVAHLRSLIQLAEDHIASSLDSEKRWNSYWKTLGLRSKQDQKRFRRLNPRLDYDPPQLDDVRAMANLQETVREFFQSESRYIYDIAHQLVASCFYFEGIGSVELLSSGRYLYKGDSRAFFALNCSLHCG